MSVALGALFLGERLSKAQLGAVALAAAGVLYITISTGTAPFLGLVLAASFALYGSSESSRLWEVLRAWRLRT